MTATSFPADWREPRGPCTLDAISAMAGGVEHETGYARAGPVDLTNLSGDAGVGSPMPNAVGQTPETRGTGVSGVLLRSTFVAALGGLLFGFDTAVISGTTEALKELFG